MRIKNYFFFYIFIIISIILLIVMIVVNFFTPLYIPVIPDERIIQGDKKLFYRAHYFSHRIDLDMDGITEEISHTSDFYTGWLDMDRTYAKSYLDEVYKKFPDSKKKKYIELAALENSDNVYLKADYRDLYWIRVNLINKTETSISLLILEFKNDNNGKIKAAGTIGWKNGMFFKRPAALHEILKFYIDSALTFPDIGSS